MSGQLHAPSASIPRKGHSVPTDYNRRLGWPQNRIVELFKEALSTACVM
jgi:hypothetical protein